jgi:AcrR family transcriptional regulator
MLNAAAARSLFFEFGVPALKTGMLAWAAKTSKITLYKYFESKEVLLEAFVTQEVARIHEPIARQPSWPVSGDYLDRLPPFYLSSFIAVFLR